MRVQNTSAVGIYRASWVIEGKKFDLWVMGDTVWIQWDSPGGASAYIHTQLADPERFGWLGTPKNAKEWMGFARTVADSFAKTEA